MKTKSLFIIVSFLLMGMKALALTFTIDGIQYTTVGATSESSVSVYGYTGSLTGITIPDQVTNGGTTYTVTKINDRAFQNKGLYTVTLPTTLESIGSYAFSGNKMSEILIPGNVTYLGSNAFYNCASLETVYWYLADGKTIQNSNSSNWFRSCDILGDVYLYGTTWDDSVWPEPPAASDGNVYYYVAPSITSLKSNVSNNTLKHYEVNVEGSFYSGCYTEYKVSSKSNVTFYQQDGPYNYSSDHGKQCNMSSANTSILYCNNGSSFKRFHGYNAGTTNVSVKYRGTTLQTGISVTVNATQCTGITLSETSKDLKVGEEFTLTPTVTAERSINFNGGQWTSSNTAVVGNNYSNTFRANGAGTATITYTATYLTGTNTATCTVTVTENDIANLKLNGGETTVRANLDKMSSIKLKPTFDFDSNKYLVGLDWTSDNTEVASYDTYTPNSAYSMGETQMTVKLNQPGTANISCSHTNSNGAEVKATIKVIAYRPTLSNFAFGESTYKVVKGGTKNTSVSFTSEDAPEDVKVTYTVDDESIATFANGVLTGKKNGTTTITASHVQNDGTTVTTTADIVVADYFVDSFSLNPSSALLAPDQTLTLEPIAVGSGGHSLTYKWETSNNKVATVDYNGKVTAVAYGSALITCTINQTGDKATCRVTVQNPEVIYVGNVYYKKTDEGDGASLEVTNCAGGAPMDMTADCYDYAGSVFIPATVTHEGKTYDVTAISPYAFYNQVDLQSLVIPASVTVIDQSACEGARNLARVFFDSKEGGLQRINSRAFYGCKKLNMVDLPNTTMGIYKQAFQNCDALSDITLSTSLTYIDELAFADCKVLNNITLPDTELNINIGAFQNDVALTAITLPTSLQGLGVSAFQGCTALKEVTFLTTKKGLTVGADAFAGTTVERVNIAHLDKWIEMNFSNPAANPASISHHIYNKDGVEIINAFVPEGPIAMNNYVFYNCSALKSLQLPASLRTVNDNTLYGCTALEHVYVLATNPPYFTGTGDPTQMSDVFNKAELCVLSSALNKYKADTWWGRFKTITATATGTKCAKPTISYSGGKLTFSSKTSGASFVYDIEVADAQSGSGNNVAMTTVYKVSVYATKAGMADSDVATQNVTVGGSGGSGIKGDVDGDGTVDVNDVQTTINIILKK